MFDFVFLAFEPEEVQWAPDADLGPWGADSGAVVH